MTGMAEAHPPFPLAFSIFFEASFSIFWYSGFRSRIYSPSFFPPFTVNANAISVRFSGCSSRSINEQPNTCAASKTK
jgi:hypothetical protein